jgi:hypothetical protein
MKISVLFLSLVSSYLLYRIARFVLAYLSNARKAKNLGCLPAPEFPSPDPLGIVPVMNIIKANDAGKLPEHIIERFEKSSKKEGRPVHTMHTQFLRLGLFNTKDPKIVQAILATQFKDFELGPIRLGTFGPL